MFSKSPDPTSAPPAPPAPPPRPAGSNASRSVLGPDLKITGEVSSKGAIEVLGEVDGNIAADVLTLGAEGRVSGTIRANAVDVKGRLDGRVEARSFTMRSAAQVTADVTYEELMIESGATIEGRFQKPRL